MKIQTTEHREKRLSVIGHRSSVIGSEHRITDYPVTDYLFLFSVVKALLIVKIFICEICGFGDGIIIAHDISWDIMFQGGK